MSPSIELEQLVPRHSAQLMEQTIPCRLQLQPLDSQFDLQLQRIIFNNFSGAGGDVFSLEPESRFPTSIPSLLAPGYYLSIIVLDGILGKCDILQLHMSVGDCILVPVFQHGMFW